MRSRMRRCEVFLPSFFSIKSMDAVLSSNMRDDSMKQILEAVDEQLLMQALENEFRVAIRLICVRSASLSQ